MRAALEKETPDLLLLDIMLPDEDGLSILSRLRAASRTQKLPVIMLTAKGSEYDKVKEMCIRDSTSGSSRSRWRGRRARPCARPPQTPRRPRGTTRSAGRRVREDRGKFRLKGVKMQAACGHLLR